MPAGPPGTLIWPVTFSDILAPDHPLTPTSHLRLGRECELASLDAVDHDDAVIVVGLVGLRFVRAVLDHHSYVRTKAVHASIRMDVARTEDERDQILSEWKLAKKDATKEAWQFWIFCSRRRCGARLGRCQKRLAA